MKSKGGTSAFEVRSSFDEECRIEPCESREVGADGFGDGRWLLLSPVTMRNRSENRRKGRSRSEAGKERRA